MTKPSKIIVRTIALFVGVVCVLAFFWVRAHSSGPMPPSPWSLRADVVRPSENAYVLTQAHVDTPDVFRDLLEAPVEEHARIFREHHRPGGTCHQRGTRSGRRPAAFRLGRRRSPRHPQLFASPRRRHSRRG